MPVRIFISYSHKDAEFQRKLEIHFAALKREGVETFYDGEIDPGADLDVSIKRELRAANVFVALASPEYLHSRYCFEKEYTYALGRARRRTMFVVVAVVRPCQWKHTRMARYKALPEDGKEVTRWGSRDSAFEDIVNGVRRVVRLADAAPASPPPKTAKAREPAKSKVAGVRTPARKKAGAALKAGKGLSRTDRSPKEAVSKAAAPSSRRSKEIKGMPTGRKPKAR